MITLTKNIQRSVSCIPISLVCSLLKVQRDVQEVYLLEIRKNGYTETMVTKNFDYFCPHYPLLSCSCSCDRQHIIPINEGGQVLDVVQPGHQEQPHQFTDLGPMISPHTYVEIVISFLPPGLSIKVKE